MELLRHSLSVPRTVTLSLHENHFDVYRHLAAPVFLDLLQTALASTLRSGGAAGGYKMRSVSIRFRYGVSADTPELDVVMVWDETQRAIRFKLARGRLTYADGWLSVVREAGDFAVVAPLLRTSQLGDPIVYEWDLPVRNNDRDPSRNINPGVILDGVFTSRWYFLRQTVGATIDDWIQKGVGFFLAQAKIDWFTPVRELGYLRYASWVSELAQGDTRFAIPFEVQNAERMVHAQGILNFAVVDLTRDRVRKTPLPDFVREAFIGPPKREAA